jgi:hypothetical protein
MLVAHQMSKQQGSEVGVGLTSSRQWQARPRVDAHGARRDGASCGVRRRASEEDHPMSLTDVEEVYASIHEDALNDILTAYCVDRPRTLSYASPAFVPVTTVNDTRMEPIPFPGIPGGIDWRIRFRVPHIDLYGQTDPLPPELTLDPGRFSIRLAVEMCLDCRRLRIDPRPPPRRGRDGQDSSSDDSPSARDHPRGELTCAKLELFVVGRLDRVMAGDGEEAITFAVDAVEIVDIAPNDVESLLECLLFMILQAVLATIRLPLRALRVGAFELSVVQGPLIEDDQIKARGDF